MLHFQWKITIIEVTTLQYKYLKCVPGFVVEIDLHIYACLPFQTKVIAQSQFQTLLFEFQRA